jgi:hypothetical protein
MLFSSGLIAGGSLAGILYAMLNGSDFLRENVLPLFGGVGNAIPFMRGEDIVGQIASTLLFLALAAVLARFAQRSLD